LTENDIHTAFPELSFWLPDELEVLRSTLLKPHRVKMVIDPEGSISMIGALT
jgi:hypothetical protein